MDHDCYCDRAFDKFVASVLKILSGLVNFSIPSNSSKLFPPFISLLRNKCL